MPRLVTRRGASLAEAVVALALGGLVAAAATGALVATTRGLRATLRLAHGARAVRAAALVVASELGAADPAASEAGADLRVLAPRPEFRALRVAAVACAGAADAVTVDTAEAHLLRMPVPGRDSVLAVAVDSAGARWVARALQAIEAASCPVAAPFGAAPGLLLRLVPGADPAPIAVGAPVRVMEPVRLAVAPSQGQQALLLTALAVPRAVAEPVEGPLAAGGLRVAVESVGARAVLRVRVSGAGMQVERLLTSW
ncbi:MAG: hypothetical protein NW201_04675 [Gemmatimonadales bacterium]|nr:hypothetical protein [Gemmatimonadales bacterium]